MRILGRGMGLLAFGSGYWAGRAGCGVDGRIGQVCLSAERNGVHMLSVAAGA